MFFKIKIVKFFLSNNKFGVFVDQAEPGVSTSFSSDLSQVSMSGELVLVNKNLQNLRYNAYGDIWQTI